MKSVLKEQKGFALIIVIIGLALMSILGFAIIGVTASNFKMSKIDSRSQSAYYIAEAGLNKVMNDISKLAENNEYETADDFFEEIDAYFNTQYDDEGNFIINDFEKNNNEIPKAIINIQEIIIDEDTKNYIIESVGKIGNSTRKVSTTIGLAWEEEQGSDDFTVEDFEEEVFVYSPSIYFSGSSVSGDGGTVISGGLTTNDLGGGSSINVTNIYFNGPVIMDGGSASFGNADEPGNIYVNGNLELLNGDRNMYGDIHVNGNFKLKDAIIHGKVYVNGNLEFTENNINKDLKEYLEYIEYTGDLIDPKNFKADLGDKLRKVDSVPSFTIPEFSIELKEDSWYMENGYIIKGNVEETVPDNARWVVNNYNYFNWPRWDVNDGYLDNIVIISRNDIIINTATSFSGILIAPNGKVTINQGEFNGVIISKDGFEAGYGSIVNMFPLSDFFTEENMPITISPVSGNDNGENNDDDDEGNGNGNNNGNEGGNGGNVVKKGSVTIRIGKIKEK